MLDREIAQHWSHVFNLHAIAGVPTTALGLAAGVSHSPQDEKDGNKERCERGSEGRTCAGKG